jgi:hypothetical protein
MVKLKKVLSKFLKSESRSSDRYPVSKYTQCFLNSSRNEKNVPAYLSDISDSGIAFIFKQPWFDINDSIEIILLRDSKSTALKGTIVSQRIFYPNGNQDLKQALYRYSMKFESPLSAELVQRFSDELAQTAA